jgi:hypothetical protein
MYSPRPSLLFSIAVIYVVIDLSFIKSGDQQFTQLSASVV